MEAERDGHRAAPDEENAAPSELVGYGARENREEPDHQRVRRYEGAEHRVRNGEVVADLRKNRRDDHRLARR